MLCLFQVYNLEIQQVQVIVNMNENDYLNDQVFGLKKHLLKMK